MTDPVIQAIIQDPADAWRASARGDLDVTVTANSPGGGDVSGSGNTPAAETTAGISNDSVSVVSPGESAQSAGTDVIQSNGNAASGAAGADGGPAIATTSGAGGQAPAVSSGPTDMRIRLRPLIGQEATVYGTGPLRILTETGGLVFPYTPTISLNQAVNFDSYGLVHTNYDIPYYQRTPSTEISINGKFTIQNQREGQYALSAIHFLRTVSKMYFGKLDGAKAGLPPPFLLLSGYGNGMFNDIRVIVKSHAMNFEENMDLVAVSAPPLRAYLPVIFTLQLTLMVVQTPTRMREEFSLDSFRNGTLLQRGGWL